MAEILFVYPPTADPTGPYLSIPYLAAAVRSRGHSAGALDLNLLGYRELLTAPRLASLTEDCRSRLYAMPLDGLAWPQAAEYLALSLAALDGHRLTDQIEAAVADLGDPERFYDPVRYQQIYDILERSLALVSARYFPLELSFTRCDGPYHLNDVDEIRRDSEPDRNPFHQTYVDHLLPRLSRERPDVVGISATFNAQLLQAFAVGRLVKQHHPEIHVTLGGAAVTQLVLRAADQDLEGLDPFADSVVLFEGETTLCNLLEGIDQEREPGTLDNVVDLTRRPVGYVSRPVSEQLDRWPAPDYGDLPLDRYFSPEPILYLAPTRGCYWTRCAFCHYGLTDSGTAPYRRRDPDRFVEDLRQMNRDHGARLFYFAGDLIDPRYLLELAEKIVAAGLDIRFTSDLRIERSFTAESCETLRKAGMVAAAFGTESDSPRILALMDKGTEPAHNRLVFDNFARSGIAVQAMTILDFPTETSEEAAATLDLLEENIERVDLFFVEQFDLESGSRVYRSPEEYGIDEVWYPQGDRFRLRARYRQARDSKRPEERERLIKRIDRLASRYGRRAYPYAGSVAVAHTLMYFDRHGRDVFKKNRSGEHGDNGSEQPGNGLSAISLLERCPRLADGHVLFDWPYDLEELAAHTGETNGHLERRREMELRDVSRATYQVLASSILSVMPRESYYLLPEYGGPVPIPRWLWMLISCLTGEFSVAQAAESVDIPGKDAAEAVLALIRRGYLVLDDQQDRSDQRASA